MTGLVDRALETLVSEPELAHWIGLEEPAVIADLVRWQAFESALDLDMPELAYGILELDTEAILRSFGRTWGSFGSGDFQTDCLQTCLAELGNGERTLYEIGGDGSFVVHHWGERVGLASVAAGVVEGLAERLGRVVEVSPEVEGRYTRFQVRELRYDDII